MTIIVHRTQAGERRHDKPVLDRRQGSQEGRGGLHFSSRIAVLEGPAGEVSTSHRREQRGEGPCETTLLQVYISRELIPCK